MSHRTQITLTDEQYERLQDESERTGLSLAELVRRALATCYGQLSLDERLKLLDESAGIWRDRPFDGEEYVEKIRRGMKHRLTSRS